MKNSESPAFGYGYANEQSHHEEQGLTKREYFAGVALSGILSNEKLMEEATRIFNKNSGTNADPLDWGKAIGRLALLYADGILDELEKE